MKVSPLLVLILYFHDVICYERQTAPHKQLLKYPKKTKLLAKKNMQILLSKYLNKKKTKLPLTRDAYTAFPRIILSEKKIYDVPDSPFFPIDTKDYQKTRVKKVLSDYALISLRKKRSAVVPDTDKEDSKITTKPEKSPSGRRKSHRNHKAQKRHNKRKSSHQLRSQPGNQRKDDSSKSKKKNLKGISSKSGSKIQSNFSKYKKPRNGLRSKNKKRGKKSRRKHRRQNAKNAKSVTLKDQGGRRLIAAKDATIQEYPYMVSIQKNGEHWCGGALLNPRTVITTANCMWKSRQISRLKVRAGSRHSDHGGQVVGIQEVMKHPNWSIRKNPDNDVALLLLDTRIRFSDSVHGVDLPNRVMMPPFEDAWVTSWGSERRDGVVDKKTMTLQAIHARLVDRAKCNNVTQRFGVTVSENFICLAQTGKRGPCTRDTGAPAVSDGVLWGLASWGIRKPCGTERFPAMYSYIASHSNMDFIIEATKTLMSDQRFYPSLDRYNKAIDQETTNLNV